MNSKLLLVSLIAIALLLAACGGSPAPAQNQAPSAATSAPAANTQAASVPPSAPIPTVAAPTMAPTATTAPTAAPTSAPTSAAAAAPANPGDFLVNSQKAFMSHKVRVTMNQTSSADNQTRTSVVEFQPPDAIHLVNTDGTEFLVIRGKGTWGKEGGTWTKFPIDMSSVAFSMFDPKKIQDLEKAVTSTPPVFVGPDIIDGRPMFVYTYQSTVTGLTNLNLTSKNKIWIGATDDLPYKMESDSPDPVKADVTDHMVLTYNYDNSINLQPPTP